MKSIQQALTCADIRSIDIVDYLAFRGHNPTKIRNYDYWFLSPLRKEKTPSFKVNRKLNVWFDYGSGKGGDFISFAILFNGCTIKDLLSILEKNYPHQVQCLPEKPTDKIITAESPIKILNISPLHSLPLLNYLQGRNIPVSIAAEYCKEVLYQINEKSYYSIGFRNDAGGYELRNQYSKISSPPKGVTSFQNGDDKVAVFEGFFDFLSYQYLHRNQATLCKDFIVLNSLSFLK